MRWGISGQYQEKARRLLKVITENKNVLTRNEAGEAVVNGEAIAGSNFK